MGIKGPIPNRDDQVVRRNLDRQKADKITAIGLVEVPELGFDAHPLVVDLYESMKESAQSKWYEPSDWQMARLTMWELNTHLLQSKPSAVYLTAINQMLTSLLLTEGDRRRVRIEVERTPTGPTASVTSISDIYRDRLSQSN